MGKASRDQKAWHSMIFSSWKMHTCQSPMFHSSNSFRSKLRFFQKGTAVVTQDKTSPKKEKIIPHSWTMVLGCQAISKSPFVSSWMWDLWQMFQRKSYCLLLGWQRCTLEWQVSMKDVRCGDSFYRSGAEGEIEVAGRTTRVWPRSLLTCILKSADLDWVHVKRQQCQYSSC